MKVTKQVKFSYGHMLIGVEKCENPHGHNATLEVSVISTVDPDTSMVIDFGDLKAIVNNVVSKFDHAWVFGTDERNQTTRYQTMEFDMVDLWSNMGWKYYVLQCGKASTAESIVQEIYTLIHEGLVEHRGSQDFQLSVRMHETDTSWADFYG